MVGNEEEKPPDPGGGNSSKDMDIDSQNNRQILAAKRSLNPSELSPSDKVIEPKEKKLIQESAASYSTLYKHPDLDKVRKYGNDDVGPFIVHVSRDAESPNSGTSLQPINVGHTMAKENVRDIRKDGIKSLGRNRVSVEFTSAAAANSLVNNPCLGRNKLAASIPSYQVSRMGLVRGVPVEWTMEEFVSASGLKEGNGRILKARRLQRKVLREGGPPTWVPTQSVVVTFEGQILPSRVYAFYTSLVVEVYVLPTIQCRKCLRFGHIQTQCRSDARCFKCAHKHPGENCNVAPEHITCLYCSGRHFATDQRCPEFCRQKSIKKTMSELSISYQEASTRHPAVRRPYADVSKVMFAPELGASWHPSQSPPPPSPPQSPATTSYRQTVFRNPRAHTPLSPSYDRHAHQNIVSSPSSQVPNGYALSQRTGKETPNDNTLELLIMLLTNFIAKWSDCLPPDVAPLMMTLTERLSFSNGSLGQIHGME